MPLPAGLPADLAGYLTTLDERLTALEAPQGFLPAFLTTSTTLSTINAAQSGACWAILTDLKTAAYSDGSHWLRIDTGATIV